MIGVLLAFHLPVGGSVRIPDFTHVQHELVLAEVETLGRGKTRAPEISARAAYAGGLLTGHHGEVCFRGEARRFFSRRYQVAFFGDVFNLMDITSWGLRHVYLAFGDVERENIGNF